MLHEMTVAGLAIDPNSNAPILILNARDEEFSVPIWIGLTALQWTLPWMMQRPSTMTHWFCLAGWPIPTRSG